MQRVKGSEGVVEEFVEAVTAHVVSCLAITFSMEVTPCSVQVAPVQVDFVFGGGLLCRQDLGDALC